MPERSGHVTAIPNRKPEALNGALFSAQGNRAARPRSFLWVGRAFEVKQSNQFHFVCSQLAIMKLTLMKSTECSMKAGRCQVKFDPVLTPDTWNVSRRSVSAFWLHSIGCQQECFLGSVFGRVFSGQNDANMNPASCKKGLRVWFKTKKPKPWRIPTRGPVSEKKMAKNNSRHWLPPGVEGGTQCARGHDAKVTGGILTRTTLIRSDWFVQNHSWLVLAAPGTEVPVLVWQCRISPPRRRGPQCTWPCWLNSTPPETHAKTWGAQLLAQSSQSWCGSAEMLPREVTPPCVGMSNPSLWNLQA